MKIDLYTKIVLTILTVFVGILVFRDVDFVTKAQANELDLSALKIEQSSYNDDITLFIYDNSKIKEPFSKDWKYRNQCEIAGTDIPTHIITTKKAPEHSYITIEKTY